MPSFLHKNSIKKYKNIILSMLSKNMIIFFPAYFSLFFFTACAKQEPQTNTKTLPIAQNATYEKDATGLLPKIDPTSFYQKMFFDLSEYSVEENPIFFIPTATGFDYPFGPKTYYSQRNDGDGWYNRLDYRVNNHMGEDWNREGGASSDCGEPILAVADGLVVYAAPADRSWGNVIIVRHKMPDGQQIESFYAHVSSKDMVPYLSRVQKRQMIGRVGDGADPCGDSRPYGAHLHFEIRTPRYASWGNIGHCYDTTAAAFGTLDPSTFIDGHRKL
jgi:murein DD-endopeptidase MepM/ murein hydrolase activator NlpD